jgi:hypothetical protein
MVPTIDWYDHAWKLVTNGVNLQTAVISLRLVTSGYVFDEAHTVWNNGANDATDPSHNESAAGDGYTTGGKTLSGMVATNGVIDFDDVTWTALTKTFRGVVGVLNGTYGSLTDPVLFYLLPDSTPADIVSTGSDYSILWNATDGLFYRPDLTV